MGLFKNNRENVSNSMYDNDVKPYLVEKDGLVHLIMVTSFSKLLNQQFDVEKKYTTQLDTILSRMQQDGYEIVDVKLNSMHNEGITGQATQFQTTIIYK